MSLTIQLCTHLFLIKNLLPSAHHGFYPIYKNRETHQSGLHYFRFQGFRFWHKLNQVIWQRVNILKFNVVIIWRNLNFNVNIEPICFKLGDLRLYQSYQIFQMPKQAGLNFMAFGDCLKDVLKQLEKVHAKSSIIERVLGTWTKNSPDHYLNFSSLKRIYFLNKSK